MEGCFEDQQQTWDLETNPVILNNSENERRY